MQLIRKFRSSLRTKLASIMLLLSLGSLAAISVITLYALLGQLSAFSERLGETEAALRTNVVGRNLTGAAADTATDLDTYLLERIEDVRRWSEEAVVIAAAAAGSQAAQQTGLGTLAADPQAVRQALNGGLFIPIDSESFGKALSFLFSQTERPQTPFIEIMLTESHGINVLVTRPMEQVAHSNQDWWQAAVTPSLAGIGILGPRLDTATNQPVVGIALPIVDDNSKQIVGVIRALVSLNDLQRRISLKAFSTDADIQVILSEGLLIAETASNHNTERILAAQVDLLQAEDATALAALKAPPGPEGSGFMMVRGAQGNIIVGYAQTSGSDFYDMPAQLSGFKGFTWGVTVAQPEQRALQVLSRLIEARDDFALLPNRLGTTFGVVSLVTAILALAGAILFSGSITRPLVQLNQMSRRVQQGDLNAQVRIQSQDEVGELGQAFNQMTEGLRQRERERDIFGRVVSPEVREKLLSGKLELGGETRWVSVLFSDIRNFSTMSEHISPQEVVAFLNEYLTEMSQAIQPWGGYINNFIGDAIVAIFGAPIDQPDNEWRSVAAAIQMRQRLDALNQRRVGRGETPIECGIGISTGEAVAGQIGSLERLLYTVIGDAVNVAARLETLTKDFPEHAILINEKTAEAIRQRPQVTLKALGPIQVKGRSEAVNVYAVVDWELFQPE